MIKWSKQSTFLTVGSLTLLKVIGALIGLVYSILQVRIFGATETVDAYFVATAAVYLISSLTQGGQLAEVFLPEYLKEKERNGISSASKLLSAVLNRVSVVLSIVLLILFFIARWIISFMGPGLEPDFQVLAASLFQVSLILVLFNIISAFVNTALNAEQFYGRAEVTALINSSISIIILLVFNEQFGIWVLIFALLAGKISEFLIGMYYLKKIGFTYSFIYNTEGYELKRFFQILYTTSGYVGATQIYNVILTALASFLPEGSLSIYNYVRQLSNRAKGIILSPITTIFFSKFAKKVAQGKANLSDHLRLPLVALGLIGLTQICLIVLIGKPLLHLIWGEDSISNNEFHLAYIMLVLNMIGVGINMGGTIFRKAAVALHGAKKLYLLWIFAQLATAAYSFSAIKVFGIWGLASIPLFNIVALDIMSLRVARLKGVGFKSVFKNGFSKSILLFIFLIILTTLILSLLEPNSLSYVSLIFLKGGSFLIVFIILFYLFFKKKINEFKKYFNGRAMTT